MPKKLILTAWITCWLSGALMASDLLWSTNFTDAKAKAKTEGKMVLLNFTCSDWDTYPFAVDTSIKNLNANVLAKPEFASYAKTNLILVEVDFPHAKPMPNDLKVANQALKVKYGVDYYPCLVVIEHNGAVILKVPGYSEGELSELISKLKEEASVARVLTRENIEIYAAAKSGDKEMVKELLEGNSALVFSKDSDGNTALHLAVGFDHKDVAEMLLANKADVNVTNNDGNTPLHLAAAFHYKDVVETLLANKADVNDIDNDGKTPLALTVASEPALTINETVTVYGSNGVPRTIRRSNTNQEVKEVEEVLRQHGGHE